MYRTAADIFVYDAEGGAGNFMTASVINAVSINNILCNSPEIRESLEKQNKMPEDSVDSFMAAFVNDVDHSDEAGVAIYDRNRHLRVLYNPGKLPDFEHSARNLVDKYAGRNNISYKENYAIPNKAIGFVKDDNKKIYRLCCYRLFR